MSIITVVATAVIGGLLSIILKKTNPQFSVVVAVLCGIIIVIPLVNSISDIFMFTNGYADIAGISDGDFKLLIKAIGIGYIAQFGINTCKTAGETGLADKVEIAAKIIILCLCLPLVENLFDIVEKISGII